jgi:ABC-type dipeptide/oligopeptide/nickel transport system permease subunit
MYSVFGRVSISVENQIGHEDFVMGARLDGASELRIILLYLVPSFMSHIIAALSLAVPLMILPLGGECPPIPV